jgi:hypothetical protein
MPASKHTDVVELEKDSSSEPVTTLERVTPHTQSHVHISLTPHASIEAPTRSGISYWEAVSGVNESRKVETMLQTSRTRQPASSQRQAQNTIRGNSPNEPIMVDDVAQPSKRRSSKPDLHFSIPVDDDELAINESKQQKGKKRQGSQVTGTRSEYFLKRPKSVTDRDMEDFDPEVQEIPQPPLNGRRRNGRVSQDGENLRRKFKRDADDEPRSSPTTLVGIGHPEDSCDELAYTPHGHQNAKKVHMQVHRNRQASPANEPQDQVEIPESPPREVEIVTSQADIPPTRFVGHESSAGKRGKGTGSRKGQRIREEIFDLQSYRDLTTFYPGGPGGLYLKYDETQNEFLLFSYDDTATLCSAIPLAKVDRAIWSPEEDCNLVRVYGVKTAQEGNLIWDLAFHHHQGAKDFIRKLKEMTTLRAFSKKP